MHHRLISFFEHDVGPIELTLTVHGRTGRFWFNGYRQNWNSDFAEFEYEFIEVIVTSAKNMFNHSHYYQSRYLLKQEELIKALNWHSKLIKLEFDNE